MKTRRASRDVAVLLNLGSRWGPVVSATPRPFYPQERDPVPVVQEAGLAPGLVVMVPESLASSGI
jgi:hypothetical protein